MSDTPSVHCPEGMTVHKVSDEEWREYVFDDGFVYRIELPSILYIKRKDTGDSHRVVDGANIVHYIPANWRILRWAITREAKDHVAF